jgi:hypothetical protein
MSKFATSCEGHPTRRRMHAAREARILARLSNIFLFLLTFLGLVAYAVMHGAGGWD